MSKTVVVMLGVLCLVVGGASYALVQVGSRLAADLHHSTVALDALVTRVTTVEEDLANISDDVYAMADDLAAIADGLALDEEDDGEGGESVALRRPTARAAARALAVRLERVRVREARRARFASVASHGSARAVLPADRIVTPH